MRELREESKGLNFSDQDEFEQKSRETYLPHLQRERVVFRSQLELIKNMTALAQARETHHNVNEIVSMQRKVEWLEVFFASYYAAALTYYISHHEALGITIAESAIGVGLVVLPLLKTWEHWDHSSKKYRLLFSTITAIAVMGFCR
jgi:tRNA isopentenyl-2-thiomethyl-A-37 hydroxylase MiaE